MNYRLKREDYIRTKHDSEFSKWQVLIGPSDWEDYSQGKEGVANYRIHNLPNIPSPGVYEIGVAVTRSGLGRDVGKLDSDAVVVAYLGQADNVRSRLQRYGRSGAHLRSSYCTGHWDVGSGGSGLFEDIFRRGYPIVFRWAPMKDKRDAERTEALLLNAFDYAWNKGSNGKRRPDDIHHKLDQISSRTSKFSKISNRLQFLSQGRVGVKIKASGTCSVQSDEDSNNFLSGIFKFSRWQPRLVMNKSSIDDNVVNVCGFIMNDGVPCNIPPVPGRKRCEEHRGRRIYGLISKPVTTEDNLSCRHDVDQLYNNVTCGVNLGDGTLCKRPPVSSRKRCEEHKAMRANSSLDKVKDNDTVLEPEISRCGATLKNGSLCTRQPVAGNKRCWQHKGKKVDSCNMSRNSVVICGGTLLDGSACTSTPAYGRKRCELHKGMRVTAR